MYIIYEYYDIWYKYYICDIMYNIILYILYECYICIKDLLKNINIIIILKSLLNKKK